MLSRKESTVPLMVYQAGIAYSLRLYDGLDAVHDEYVESLARRSVRWHHTRLPAWKKSCMLSLSVCATARLKRPCRQKTESVFLFRRELSPRTHARQTYCT